MPDYPASRREFLRLSFAFSAAAALSGSLPGCGKSVSSGSGGSNSTIAPSASPEVAHFIAIGDYGQDPTGGIAAQAAVASAMQSYVQELGITVDALLMLGDNFYGALTGVDDARWQTQFEQMYPQSVFGCPAYAIPGNHDYDNFGSPNYKYSFEMAYAARGGTRWTIPNPYYTLALPANNPLITIHALDSNVPGLSLQSNDGFPVMSSQTYSQELAWLTAEIAKTVTTPFQAVMAHHPLYSDGPHGDNPALITDWDPLLRAQKVHLYMSGHDHDLQHLEFVGHPTSFVLSGGGGANLYDPVISAEVRGPYVAKVYGFTHIEVTSDLLIVHHVDNTGSVVHSFSKTPAGVVSIL